MAMAENLHPAGEPDYAVPPGETIREFLDELGMTQRQLARRLDLSPKHVNQLVQGLVSLSPEVAERLELVTGMPARLWNRLEADYQSARQRLRRREDLAELVPWLEEIPLRALRRRGVLPDTPDDPVDRVQQLLAFFGVAHVSTYRELYERPADEFRRTRAPKADPGAVAAWLRLGELAARDVVCDPFDRKGLRDSLDALRQLTVQPPRVFRSLMSDICARNGVAVAIVPEIKGARASGVVRWLAPDRVMLLLSGHYKTDDHMWFTFFHGLGHILLHDRDKAEVWIEGEGPGEGPAEREADGFARDILIPPGEAHALTEVETLAQAQRFADEIGVAPSIVVGRLQDDKVLKCSIGNRLRRKINF